MKEPTKLENMTFWQHLEVLRWGIIRCLIAISGISVIAFFFKDYLFRFLFWPTQTDFPIWKLIPLNIQEQQFSFINTELTQQFMIHMEMSMIVGAMVVSPYILYELIHFISPALYKHERKEAFPAVIWGYIMFILGLLLSYFVIFPVTFRFLAFYQVQDSVANMITLRSYTSSLLTLSMLMGVMFELPIVCHVLARLGLLTAEPMRHYRRHAIVGILIVAAVITPTGDAFTLSLVSLPIYFLYELSILIVRHQESKRAKSLNQ